MKYSKEDKETMVSGFSEGRASSSKDLYSSEAATMIDHLQSFAPKVRSEIKMKRSIIAMAHDMNWKLPNGKADIARINDWCKKFGHVHKELDDHTHEELQVLVFQFKKMFKEHSSNKS